MSNDDNDFSFTFNRIREASAKKLKDLAETLEPAKTNVEKALNDLSETVRKNSEEIRKFSENSLDTREQDDFIRKMQRLSEENGIKVSDTKPSSNETKVVTPTQQSQESSNKQEVSKVDENQGDKKAEDQESIKKLLDRKKIRGLSEALKQRVFGQDEIIDELVNVLKIASVELKINGDKPVGCYLAAGPSGVGKTEVATVLAEVLGVPLKRFDMAEFGMENDVVKLIGAPPGYKGFDQGGQLTNWGKENKYSVVILDEIEKAHEDMDNILLALMDKGVATDGQGQKVEFKNTIFFVTTNVGSKVEYLTHLTKEEKNKMRMDAMKQRFKAEILGRYDSTFQFNPLSLDIYEKVVMKFLSGLNQTFKEKYGGELKQSEKLIKFVVHESYDPAYGGRPARKFIEKVALPGLADYILEHDDFEDQVKEHGSITLDINKDNNICFKGKKGVILGVLKNTADLLATIKEAQNKQDDDELVATTPINIKGDDATTKKTKRAPLKRKLGQ